MANNRELSQFASLITVDDSTRTLGINTSIYVSGVSTFVGVGTFNDDLYVQDKLYVGGIEINAGGSSIGTDITTRNLQVTGIATVNSNLIVNGNTLYVDATNNTVGIGTSSSIGTALQKLQVEGGAYFSGNVGIGTTNPGEKLQIDDYNSTQTYSQNVRRTQTDFASGVGVGVNFQDYQTTSGTRYASGSNSIVSTSVAAGVTNSGYIRGGLDAVWRNNNNENSSTDNGTLDDLYGRTIQLGHYNDFAVSPITNNVTGLQITPYAYTGSIGVFQGINVSSVINAVGATVTNVYGLRSQIATNDGINPYNLYIDGAAKNYIAGNLGIGTTIPTSKLHVIGDTLVTGVSTILSNSSTEAFRITQTGTGNAFVVEDATNPDATPFVIMADGKVGVGTTGMIQYGSGASDTSTFGILASTGNDSAFVLKGNNGSTTDGSGQTLAVLVGSTGASGSGTNLIHYSHDTTGIGTRRNSIRFTDTQIRFEDNVSGSVDVTINSSGSGELLVGRTSSTGTSNQLLQVEGGAYVSGSVGIGITNPTSKLTVQGDTLVTGVVTATTFIGAFTGIAASATQLVTPRTFEITGDVVASAISFDGTGNVSLAATIQPNSVGLGTDTTGDYVRDITGTSNQITVTSGTGESSTPTLSIPNQFTAPQDVTVTRDLQVNRNLNVNGNITIGGSSATIFTNELKVYDPDIVLGVRTDGSGNDISNDTTANHGGIAVASTEGTPLVSLYDVGVGETNPATYKKIMWFKSGTFTGLNTDAWLINYAVGIGSTQFPSGTRLAAGSVQFTENDLAVVRNINASGVSTFTNGPVFIGAATSTGTSSQTLQVTGGAYVSGAVGIAITNPQTALHLGGGGNIRLNRSDNTRYGSIYHDSLGLNIEASSSGDNIYINTDNINGRILLQNNSSTTLTAQSGTVLIGTGTSTGTASQTLQVTGGAYVSTRLGVGVTNPGALLDVGNNTTNIVAIFGGDTGATTRTDATDKSARIATPHYTNSEEPAALLYALNGSNYNNISIGGGTALMNAATGIEFYTASNTTTVTGTKALTIDNSQRVAIGTDIVGARLHVVSGSNQPAGLFSGTTSADMVRITQLGTGNALVVEDETNPDSTPFVVTGIGSVGIGITNPVTKLHVSDGNGGISTALYTLDYLTISAQNTAPGFNIIAAGSSGTTYQTSS